MSTHIDSKRLSQAFVDNLGKLPDLTRTFCVLRRSRRNSDLHFRLL